jgi:hypothetical protein
MSVLCSPHTVAAPRGPQHVVGPSEVEDPAGEPVHFSDDDRVERLGSCKEGSQAATVTWLNARRGHPVIDKLTGDFPVMGGGATAARLELTGDIRQVSRRCGRRGRQWSARVGTKADKTVDRTSEQRAGLGATTVSANGMRFRMIPCRGATGA